MTCREIKTMCTRAGRAVLKGAGLSLVALVLVSAIFQQSSEAAGGGFDSRRYYKLSFGVDLRYDGVTSDTKKFSAFSQDYSLGFSGFVIDPRLMNFGIRTYFSDTQLSGNVYRSTGGYGFAMDMSFLNRIDENRGLKLWRYLPKPISLQLMYHDDSDYSYLSYGISTSFIKPGHLRILGNNKIFYYDDGRKVTNGNNTNANSFRVKYQNYNRIGNGNGNGNGNWNRNGNGNWNRNGNGNWNRNGNGNWNRNGNGNWNRNGNGNWNRNGNGNWNRNGNGNWNRNGNGNWNRNGNGNWNRNGNGNWGGNQGTGGGNQGTGGGNQGTGGGNNNQGGNWGGNANWNSNVEGKKSWTGFKFPALYADYNHTTAESKGSGLKSEYSVGLLRATVDNEPVKIRDKAVYDSRYNFHYRFIESNTSSQNEFSASANNKWQRLNTYSKATYRKINDSTFYIIEGYGTFDGKFKEYMDYTITARGNYTVRENVDTINYGLGWRGFHGLNGQKRISPHLTHRYNLDVSFARSEGSGGQGRTLYGVTATEQVVSTHLRSVRLQFDGSTGYSENGVPLALSIKGDSKKLRRAHLSAEYRFSTYFSNETSDRVYVHFAALRGSFNILPQLTLSSELSRSMTSSSTGDGDSSRSVTRFRNTARWRISSKSSLSGTADLRMTDVTNYYDLSAVYQTKVFRRGRVVVDGLWRWNDRRSGMRQEYGVVYSWKMNKLTFSARYDYLTTKSNQVHTYMVIVKREFSKFFRRLF